VRIGTGKGCRAAASPESDAVGDDHYYYHNLPNRHHICLKLVYGIGGRQDTPSKLHLLDGCTGNGHARCHVSLMSIIYPKSLESLFNEFLRSDDRPPHRAARCGCTLAPFYLLSQQTSISITAYPTNGQSGSHSHSSSYGKSPTYHRPHSDRRDAEYSPSET
jgi:hypothetical protein